MKNLLIVDDSKTILKLVDSFIQKQEFFKPYYAENLEETKALIKEHSFFGALCDLVLPDAKNGEVVDYCLGCGLPTIAMTASVDPELRDNIIKKPIIDYVIKNTAHDIERAVTMFETFHYMKGEKALIVDDSKLARSNARELLERLLFEVSEAENGAEAMSILKGDTTFKLIVTDYNMPIMNGVRLIQKINNAYPNMKCVIFGITGSNNPKIRYGFLKNGANDYFNLPLIKEEVNAKIFSHMRQAQIQEESELLRQKAEQNEKDFRLLIEGVGSEYLIFHMNLDGTLSYISSAIESFAGITVEQALGNKWSDIFEIPEDSIEKVIKNHEALISGKNTEPYEANYIHPDGTLRTIEATDRLEVDDKGNPLAIFGVLKDLTERKKIETQLLEMSLTDSMTKLFNRRYYNEYFPKLLNIGKREKKPVAMIMFDVDKFKQYNDNYGHQKGDDALIAIGETLNMCCKRGSDTPLRLGGEEFAVLVSDADDKEAAAFAEKIRAYIEALQIPHDYNDASEFLTASFGVAVINPDSQTDMDTIYKLADEALYEAKENGRNCTILKHL